MPEHSIRFSYPSIYTTALFHKASLYKQIEFMASDQKKYKNIKVIIKIKIDPHEQELLHNITENGFDNILRMKYNSKFYIIFLIMLLRIL